MWTLIVMTCLSTCTTERIATYKTLEACEAAMEVQYQKIEKGAVGCIPAEEIKA